MPRFDLILLAACFCYCSSEVSFALAENENHITHGPILGRLSPNSIRIWARTARTGSFGVRYGLSPKEFRITGPVVSTQLEHDNTGWVVLSGLKANTKYFYHLFLPGSQRPTGRGGSFKTLPDTTDYVDPELNRQRSLQLQLRVRLWEQSDKLPRAGAADLQDHARAIEGQDPLRHPQRRLAV